MQVTIKAVYHLNTLRVITFIEPPKEAQVNRITQLIILHQT